MTFNVTLFEPHEAEASAQVYLEAFENSPMHQMIFPLGHTPTFLREEREQELQSILRGKEKQDLFIIAVVDTSLRSAPNDIYHHQATGGTIVAKAKWLLEDSESPVNRPAELPTEANADAVKHFMSMYIRRRGETMKGRGQYWYLQLLACRPDQRGRGAGTEGLKWGLRRAREMGVLCYLSASPAGKKLYSKWGFRTVWTETLDCSNLGRDELHIGTGMVWEPTENADINLEQS